MSFTVIRNILFFFKLNRSLNLYENFCLMPFLEILTAHTFTYTTYTGIFYHTYIKKYNANTLK